jgi:coniferyl-aldehyde dehydrogenase
MRRVLDAQKAAFDAERHRPLAERKDDIARLEAVLRERTEDISKAVSADYGRRSSKETLIAETSYLLAAGKHARKHLARWADARPKPLEMTLKPGKAYVRREPKGVAGIVAPWNYPVQLALAPLIAALAAGCRAMIKPSEFTPRTAELLREIVDSVYDEDHVAVIPGGPDVAQAFTALPFDHLFYTGSTHVGRLVAKAAAENLTPVTLELGGKSPAVVGADMDVAQAARPIAWGKYFNAGQTCVAPDYVMTPKGRQQAFAEAVIAEVSAMWPEPSANEHYTAIVSERHYERIARMVEEAREAGATVLQSEAPQPASNDGARVYPPTVVVDPPLDSALMTEEIFGPVLPVISHDGLEDACRFINERDRPLALYVFSKSTALARRVLRNTISGGAAVNMPLVHLSAEELPFGGVGASGYGSYHGEAGFLTFTHERSVLEVPTWHPVRMIMPPYGKAFDFVSKLQSR